MAPTSGTCACGHERRVKSGAEVMMIAAKRAGKSGMAVRPGENAASLSHPFASSTPLDPTANWPKSS